MPSFHERLTELRKSRNLTQNQLADEIGAHVRAIQFYEADRKPTLDVLLKLSEYFDCSIDYLVGRSDNPERR